MTAGSEPVSMNDYIAQFPPETQRVLQDLRALIAASAPDAVETISYGIPTFDVHGRHLVHFAAYERHVGFYPTSGPIEAFREELASYKIGKGSVQLPLDRPLPTDLLRRMVAYRVDEASRLATRTSARRRTGNEP